MNTLDTCSDLHHGWSGLRPHYGADQWAVRARCCLSTGAFTVQQAERRIWGTLRALSPLRQKPQARDCLTWGCGWAARGSNPEPTD